MRGTCKTEQACSQQLTLQAALPLSAPALGSAAPVQAATVHMLHVGRAGRAARCWGSQPPVQGSSKHLLDSIFKSLEAQRLCSRDVQPQQQRTACPR